MKSGHLVFVQHKNKYAIIINSDISPNLFQGSDSLLEVLYVGEKKPKKVMRSSVKELKGFFGNVGKD